MSRAIGSVIILLSIENEVTKYWTKYSESLPNWLIKIVELIPKPLYPNDLDNVTELISIIAGVSGVILALFYPVLATILSTAYAKVHSSIRDLLLKEESTQTYLKELIFLTAFSIFVLLCMSFRIYPGNLILFFLAYLSIVTLYRIQKIGLGVYHLMEPSSLIRINNTELAKAIYNSTTSGEFWYDKGFQSRNYRMAYIQIENLSIITNLCSSDSDLRETSFKEAVKESYRILQLYIALKPKIPYDSIWFPNTYQHISYFESDQTLRGLAKNTNTFIQPKVNQNHYWFEEKILSNIANALEKLREQQNLTVLSDTIRFSYPLLDSFSSSADIKNTTNLLDSLFAPIKNIANRTSDGEQESYSHYKYEIACVEAFCYSILRFQITLIEEILKFNSEKFKAEFRKINWTKTSSIYTTDFIPDLFELLNTIRQNIQNEFYVEKRQITPDWYFIQQLTAVYLKSVTEKLESSLVLFEKYIIELCSVFATRKKPLLSSLSAHLGLEILFKLNYRFGELQGVFNDLDSLEVCKKEFTWTKPDFKKLKELLDAYESKCLSFIVNDLEQIQVIKWDSHYPDIFSQSYSVVSSKLNNALSIDSIKAFENLFPSFLKAAILSFGNFKTHFQHIKNLETISYQVLIDVMELSGYAYLYDKLYKSDKFWPVVVKAWDESFAPTKGNIDLLATFYNYYRKNLFGTGINFNEKHDRERTFMFTVENNQRAASEVTDPLAKMFIPEDRYDSLFYDPSEIFIEVYLFTFLEARESVSLIDRNVFNKWMRYFNKR